MKNIKQNNNNIIEIRAFELLHLKLESKILYEIYSPIITEIKKLAIFKNAILVPKMPV